MRVTLPPAYLAVPQPVLAVDVELKLLIAEWARPIILRWIRGRLKIYSVEDIRAQMRWSIVRLWHRLAPAGVSLLTVLYGLALCLTVSVLFLRKEVGEPIWVTSR